MERKLTMKEQLIAEKEGWLLCYTGIQDAVHNPYELQRNDTKGIFEDDEDAQKFVILRANDNTNGIHAKAIQFLSKKSPNEVDSYLRAASPIPFDAFLKKIGATL